MPVLIQIEELAMKANPAEKTAKMDMYWKDVNAYSNNVKFRTVETAITHQVLLETNATKDTLGNLMNLAHLEEQTV